MSPRDHVDALRAAIGFLTRVPMGALPESPDAWRWAPAYFPLVGAALGLILSLGWDALAGLPDALRALVTVGLGIALTGALHEDGMADTADALGAGRTDPARVLEILKDSRIGTYGALALLFSVGIRALALASLETHALPALVLCHGLARIAPVWLMASLEYVTPASAARSSAVAKAGAPQALAANALGAIVLGAVVASSSLEASSAILAVGALGAVGLLGGLALRRWMGGFTGDFLGAVEQMAECGVLLAIALGSGVSD